MRSGMVVLRGGRTSGVTVSLSNNAITDTEFSPTAATASITLESDGGYSQAPVGSGTWLIGSTDGAAYECRATETSGTLSSNPASAWVDISANRTFRVTRSSLGTKTCTFTLEIGLVGQSTALDTATITLTATVEP
jgi:hypothetical protein